MTAQEQKTPWSEAQIAFCTANKDRDWMIAGPWSDGSATIIRGKTARPLRLYADGSTAEFDWAPLPWPLSPPQEGDEG